jgi:hypothetical protein
MSFSPKGEYLVRKAMQAIEKGNSVEPILAQARKELSGADLFSVEDSIALTQRVMSTPTNAEKKT